MLKHSSFCRFNLSEFDNYCKFIYLDRGIVVLNGCTVCTCENSKFYKAIDVKKFFKQIKFQISLHTCATISDLLYI